MRPINKGDWPLTPVTNRRRLFNDWSRAIPVLRERTGWYCHICEMRVTNSLAIEHIKPRENYPRLQNNWYNFMLICNFCNSHKGAKVPLSPYKKKYYWPHLNNTLLAFRYESTLPFIKPSDNLNRMQRAKAVRLIRLYGLNKQVNENGESDTRWIEKLSALKDAIDSFMEYQEGQITVDAIMRLARKSGFFSIWLTVFNNIDLVKTALITLPSFHLGITNCFDPDNGYQFMPRNPLNAIDPL